VPLHQLAVNPQDVSGKALRLVLNAAPPPPLVACRLGHPAGGALLLGAVLPESTDAPGYRLQSDTDTHDEAEFRRIARELRARCARESNWLGGTFPGDDAALTALAAEPDGDGWRWQTWHLYPGSPGGSGGMVVHTASRWQP
jgi:hypothetical protein